MIWIIGIVLTIALPILVVALVYFFLAKENLYCTFTEEGTVKPVVRGGELQKFLIAWKDHTFKITRDGRQSEEKDNWEVVAGKEPLHILGGLRYYGFWPIDQILEYKFKWTHLHEDGTVVSHAEWLDYALLKTDLYVIEIPLKEDGGMEDVNGVPLGMSIVMPMKIVNPYEALFIIRRWLPAITGIVQARLRKFVAKYRYKEDLLNMRAGEGIGEIQQTAGVAGEDRDEAGNDLWEKFLEELKEDFKTEGGQVTEEEKVRIYGVEIEEKKAGVIKIDPSKRYRELTTLEYESEQKKKRTVIEAEAQAIAAENIARQKALESGLMHRTIKEILKEEEGYSDADAEERAKEYVMYWKGSEEGVIQDWRFKGEGGGFFAELAKIAAVVEKAKEEVKKQK